MDKNAKLIVHADGYEATRKQVEAVKAPKFTDTWHPIAHRDFLKVVFDRLASRNILIDGDGDYALAKEDQQMFATFNLKSEARPDFALALGLRNSTDKSLSAGLCCGSRVFVCDNLAFTSEIVFYRRHTPGILDMLPETVDKALTKFLADGVTQEQLYERMKKVEISLDNAITVIRAMGEQHKILPSQQLYKVIDEYAHPRFPEFKERNAFNLMNACTTFCRHDRRAIDPMKEQDNLMGITRVIAEHCGLELPAASMN